MGEKYHLYCRVFVTDLETLKKKTISRKKRQLAFGCFLLTMELDGLTSQLAHSPSRETIPLNMKENHWKKYSQNEMSLNSARSQTDEPAWTYSS